MIRRISACMAAGLLLVSGIGQIRPARAEPGNASLFLQGTYLEVGISPQGWFGIPNGVAVNIPEGFHNTTENGLGFVADYQRDGWKTGSPLYGGDYLQAGSPYEGFTVEWTSAGNEYVFCQDNDICGPQFRNTSLVETSAGDILSATWMGEVSASNGQTLQVIHKMQFGKDDLFILIETTLKNTGPSALESLEFFRGVDPDNDQAWPGGDFDTYNQVVHQPDSLSNPDRVLLRAAGTNHPDMLLFLGSVDGRARGSLDRDWLMDADQVLDAPSTGPRLADDALALAWRLGTLEPDQEIKISYFYGFGTDNEAEAFLDELGTRSCDGTVLSLLGGDLSVQNWIVRIPPAAVPQGSCLQMVIHDPASLPFDGSGLARLGDPVEVKILPPDGPALVELPFPYQLCFSYQDGTQTIGNQNPTNLLIGSLVSGNTGWTLLTTSVNPALKKVCAASKNLGSFGLFTPLEFPSTGFAPGNTTSVPIKTPGSGITKHGSLWLEIPRLQLTADIVGVPLTEAGWDISWLDDKIGWLEGSEFPATPGNSILTGHVWNATGHPGPFYRLNSLWYGDFVILHSGDLAYQHEVRSITQVTADEFGDIHGADGHTWLTLVTCRGYDEITGDYRWRILVQAVLTAIDQEEGDGNNRPAE